MHLYMHAQYPYILLYHYSVDSSASCLSATEVKRDGDKRRRSRSSDQAYSSVSQRIAATGCADVHAPLMTQKGPRDRSHPVRLYVERVASQDLGEYPEWDLTVCYFVFLSPVHTGVEVYGDKKSPSTNYRLRL